MIGVTVVIPAHNAGAPFAGSLPTIADHFSLYRSGGYDFSYVIVEDGSSDETRAVAQRFARWRSNVRVVSHLCHRGVGAALRTAFNDLHADYAIVLDPHLGYAPSTGMELLEALERENADIAVASSRLPGRVVRLRGTYGAAKLGFGGAYEALVGLVRAYRVAALQRLSFSADGVEALPELLARALHGGMNVIAVPATPWHETRRAGVREAVRSMLAALKYFPVLAFGSARHPETC